MQNSHHAAGGVCVSAAISFAVNESVNVKLADAAGTSTHGEPSEKATFLTSSFAPKLIPASFVSGDKLKSLTAAEVLLDTSTSTGESNE